MRNCVISSAALLALASTAGCKKADPNRPTAEQCQSGCARVAKWKIAADKKVHDIFVHETDERVDDMEAETKRDVGLLRAQLAAGDVPLDEKALAKLSPKDRETAIARHDYDAKQLTYQRNLAIQKQEDALAEVKALYVKVKTEDEAWEKKAMEDAVAQCLGPCMARPTAFSQCLVKTQAAEDVSVCEQM